MKEITIRLNNIGDMSCEITSVLNQFNTCKSRASQLYIYPYSNEYVLIRGVGATRGCIKFNEEYIITEILIYDEHNYDLKYGIFNPSDQEKIYEAMKKFIGCKLQLDSIK